ncbi:MAG: hypothetical protein IPN22_07590 [Bacteroidetes bacterium]|nr:hypothetical protein [Bacteroidota bacterium]
MEAVLLHGLTSYAGGKYIWLVIVKLDKVSFVKVAQIGIRLGETFLPLAKTRNGHCEFILPLAKTRNGHCEFILPLAKTRNGHCEFILPLVKTCNGHCEFILPLVKTCNGHCEFILACKNLQWAL